MEFSTIEIQKNLFYVGVNDRHTGLFENMWPLENGISYNSYLLKGEKNILIDPVHASCFELYLSKIRSVIGQDGTIDYLIINHMEPDHSSSISLLLNVFPKMKLVGNSKTAEFIKGFYKLDISENFIEVGEGETHKFGNFALTFYKTPMAHWPESMVTYYKESKTLFSQDLYGGFGTIDGGIFDDEIDYTAREFERARYFTNVVGKFASQILRATKKLENLEIKTICPVHGIVWRSNPEKIVKFYDDLANCRTKNGVVIAYGTMYGNTEKMADYLANTLSKNGVRDVRLFDVSKTHVSYIFTHIWLNKGLFLGSASYNNALFPVMQELISLISTHKMKNHILGIFGTYAWSGGGVKNLLEFAKNNTEFDFIDMPVEARCSPNYDDLQHCKALAEEMAKRVLA